MVSGLGELHRPPPDWYIEMVKGPLGRDATETQKRAAAATLVHVLDASRAVNVVSDLLDGERKKTLDASNRERQAQLREQHATKKAMPTLSPNP